MSDAARFLAALADRDAEGMTPGQLADWLDEGGIEPVDARGRQRTYRLSGRSLQGDRLQRTIGAVQAAGGVLSPSPSLDLANYMDDDEEPGDLEDYDVEDVAA